MQCVCEHFNQGYGDAGGKGKIESEALREQGRYSGEVRIRGVANHVCLETLVDSYNIDVVGRSSQQSEHC